MVFAFDRELERDMWFPILEDHGFSNLHSSADKIDFDNAIDAVGHNNLMQPKRFALRTRESQYSVDRLAEYKREFTIRYKGATDEPVEWQKLFEMDLDTLPDYFCYGWWIKGTNHITDYVILDVPILQQLHKDGHLTRYEENNKIHNTRGTRTTMVVISLSQLLGLPSSDNLIVYHSHNHPALY